MEETNKKVTTETQENTKDLKTSPQQEVLKQNETKDVSQTIPQEIPQETLQEDSEEKTKKVTKKTKKQEKKIKKEESVKKQEIRHKLQLEKEAKKEKKKILKPKQIKINNYKEKKEYTIEEAINKLKENKIEKFNGTVTIVFNLNLNSKKFPEHNLRGFFKLPHPLKKELKICVITRLHSDAASKHNPFLLGGKDVVEDIVKKGQINFDLLLATPEMMTSVRKLGKILGPKKLMPSSKDGTLTGDLDKAMKAWKNGRQKYHCDPFGSLSFVIGKVEDDLNVLQENFKFCHQLIQRIKPQNVKGKYIKNSYFCSTMSPGLKITLN